MPASVVHAKQTAGSAKQTLVIVSPAVGNMLVVFISQTNSVLAPTLGLVGATKGTEGWTVNATHAVGNGSTGSVWVGYKVIGAGEAGTEVEAKPGTGGTVQGISVLEVNGATSTVDTIVHTDNTGTVATVTSPSVTTTGAGDIVLAAVGMIQTQGSNTVGAWEGTGPMTNVETGSTRCIGGYYVPGTTLSGATFTAKWETARTVAMLVVAFKAEEGIVNTDSGTASFTLAAQGSDEASVEDSGKAPFTLATSGVDSWTVGNEDEGAVKFTILPSGAEAAVYTDTGAATFGISATGTDEAENEGPPEPSEGGLVFTDVGTATFIVTANGVDEGVGTDAKPATFSLSVSGGDVAIYGDAGSASFSLGASGTDGVVYADTDSGSFSLGASGTDGIIYTDTDSGLFSLGASGTDGVVYTDAGSAPLSLSVSGVDSWIFGNEDQGAAKFALGVQGTESVVFTDIATVRFELSATGKEESSAPPVPSTKEQEDQQSIVPDPRYIRPKYVAQQTLQYKTFLKRAVVEALQNAFRHHPDPEVAETKVGVEYKTDRVNFPSIVVKFYERSIDNAGVGHLEWGPSPADPNYPDGPFALYVKYYHRIYKGDLEFEVLAMSPVDRDKVVDALVEILTMADVTEGGLNLLNRLYEDIGHTPFSESHFIAFNTDLLTGYGEGKEIAPWIPEDTLVYTASYRVPILGEFYSQSPKTPESLGLVQEVDVYPWDDRDPLDTPPANFPHGEVPAQDYTKLTGRPVATATGTVVEGSPTITRMSSVTGMQVGNLVRAQGFGTNATIIGIPSSSELTISEEAASSVTNTVVRVTDIQKKL